MKQKKWLAALLAVSVFALAACNDKEKEEVVQEEIPKQVTQVEEKPTSPVEETDEKANEEVTVDEEAKTILTSTGTYLESVDATHVKIQVGKDVAVYELIAETQGIFDGIENNVSVTFDYYEGNKGTRVLVSLLLNEALEPKDEEVSAEVKSDEWLFVGMIDGHSSEFKKGDAFIVAQYNESQFDTINGLDEKDTVRVEYTVNSNGTYVLKTIAKK